MSLVRASGHVTPPPPPSIECNCPVQHNARNEFDQLIVRLTFVYASSMITNDDAGIDAIVTHREANFD